ncbi:MAG: coproporphyrinogen III oxidase [Myxococcota bacterium]
MRVPPRSARAHAALTLVESLQQRLVAALERVAADAGAPTSFAPSEWERDGGAHGGGARFGTGGGTVFDRASINVSQVHYDDQPERALSSATALSSIVHPRHPLAPSMHLHTSWTETRDGAGYWRVMADLNPSHPDPADTLAFRDALRAAAPGEWAVAEPQGDRYFAIPAVGRTRGVTHFYLEAWGTGDFDADRALAERVERAAIDTYAPLIARHQPQPVPDGADRRQREYHTLYLFQVLTLDRGTTSGLLIHDQNDLGILGSLPSRVDPALLAQWADRVPPPQDALVRSLVEAVGGGDITDAVKGALAQRVRAHYRAHPAAIELQARGDVVPPTVANHR